MHDRGRGVLLGNLKFEGKHNNESGLELKLRD